jgi:hypothetical protein
MELKFVEITSTEDILNLCWCFVGLTDSNIVILSFINKIVHISFAVCLVTAASCSVLLLLI